MLKQYFKQTLRTAWRVAEYTHTYANMQNVHVLPILLILLLSPAERSREHGVLKLESVSKSSSRPGAAQKRMTGKGCRTSVSGAPRDLSAKMCRGAAVSELLRKKAALATADRTSCRQISAMIKCYETERLSGATKRA